MSDKRTAVVFETNFIIEHLSKLQDIYEKLSEHYDVFVPDISIQERLSQKYLELQKKYEEIENFRKKYPHLISISIKKSFNDQFEAEKKETQSAYLEAFGNNIIPYDQSADTLNTIMDRVFKKIPPFINADKASDKGFKDTMLWLSLLEFFKNYETSNIIFLTNDNGFRNNVDKLCGEFNKYTSKTIEIRENDYYNTLIEKKEESAITVANESSEVDKLKNKVNEPLPDMNLLREKIQNIIFSLCCGEYDVNGWGELQWIYTFALHEQVTSEDMKAVFDNLREILNSNIFETDLPPDKVFIMTKKINNRCNIPLNALQDALYLYEDIYTKHKEYLPQFYSVVANIFNKNYQKYSIPPPPPSDDEMPF